MNVSRLLLWLSIGLISFSGYSSSKDLSDKVKAAYLLNFIRYTEWPAPVFSDEKSPLLVCLIGTESFKEIMQEAAAIQKISERSVVVKRIDDHSTISKECHVVYVGRALVSQDTELMNIIKDKPILTVGESELFANGGGMISFVSEPETIQFLVNLGAAEQAGLKISSRMLSLAKKVITK